MSTPEHSARTTDLDGFELLVHEHVPAAYRVAVALVGESLAPPLVQDAFLTAWQRLPHLRDLGRFAPWLLRIVVGGGRARLHRASTVREIPVTVLAETGPGAVTTHADPATSFAALAYDQRAILALHAAAGLSVRDCAEALDLREGMARSRLEGALEALGRRAGIAAASGPRAASGLPLQDPRIAAFLGVLGEGRVPLDLATSAIAHVRAHPDRRPSLRLPALAAAGGLLLVVAAAMAMGWRPPIDLLPGPRETSPAPPAPSPPAGEAFEFARIAVTGAELRTDAGGGSVLRRTTDEDLARLVLVRERRTVGGRAWTRVELQAAGGAAFLWLPETIPSSGPTGYEVPVLEPTGWLPCSTTSERSAEALLGTTLAQRLACFGDGSFEIGPVQVLQGATGEATSGSPAWLAGPTPRFIAGGGDGSGLTLAPLRVDPALGLDIPVDRWVRLTVHLDDPAAAGCTRTTQLVDLAVGDIADQELWCRQQLVVTGYAESGAPTPTPLPAGMWELDAVVDDLPVAPIAGREGESVTWTGDEVVVWGGDVAGDAVPPPDGAALDVRETRTWRVMARSPLSARSYALTAWTGTEVLVWGGWGLPDTGPLDDGAAWNPATDTWRRLPASSLPASERQAGAWNGSRWMVVSGSAMAAYDPASDTWRGGTVPQVDPDEALSVAWTGVELALLTTRMEGTELWTLAPGGTWEPRSPPPAGTVPVGGLVAGSGGLFVPAWRLAAGRAGGRQATLVVLAWDSAAGTWTVADSSVPARIDGSAWTGSQLVLVGAASLAWDPLAGAWFVLPGSEGDRERRFPSVVWAGDRLVVWGGDRSDGDPLPDGREIVWVGGG